MNESVTFGRTCNDKIDSFCHFAFAPVLDKIQEFTGEPHQFARLFANNKGLIDPEYRISIMDATGVKKSILSPLPELGNTPLVEQNGKMAAEVSRICNTQMAELVAKYPNRFAGVAMLPTADPDLMVTEFDYAVNELGLRGCMIGVGPTNKLIDHEDFDALFAKAEELDLPIWIHPARSGGIPDYPGEEGGSKYQYFQAYSWVNDDTLAMHRIVFSGVFERHPKVKIIIHHHGAMVPYFAGRVDTGIAFFEKNIGFKYETAVTPPYADQYKKFYIDTATQYYNPQALGIAIDFFGPDKVLFGSDAPMDAEDGKVMINGAYDSIRALGLAEDAEKMIYFENAQKLMHL